MSEGPSKRLSDFRPMTDTGNAERLIARHHGIMRYLEDRQEWRTWTSPVWRRGDMGPLYRACTDTARAIASEEAPELSDEPNVHRLTGKLQASDSDKARGHALLTESRRSTESMIALAAHMEPVSSKASDFDKDPWLLNTPSDVIDLRDMSTRPPAPELLQSHVTTAHYVPFATSQLWGDFVRTITCGDDDLAAWLQRAIGMSLIGVQREHVFIFCLGGGRNGKGTFLNTIGYALGDYALTLPPNMLVEKKNEHHPTELADLEGRRFAIGSEVPKNAAWDEVLIKTLTGGDEVSARHMRKDFVRFKASHTFWIAGNDKPRIKGTDAGIWRRMRLVPFLANIAKEDEDPDLGTNLRNDADAVLAWAVDGCRMYLHSGLGTCAAVELATASYRQDEDLIGQFLAECCQVGPTCTVVKDAMRKAMREWFSAHEYRAPSDRVIRPDFVQRGFKDVQRHGGIRFWVGVSLRATQQTGSCPADQCFGDD